MTTRFFSGVFSLLVLLTLCTLAHGETLFLEAEGFDDVGGWAVDQQFQDIMQTSNLLAHGMGEPVADATTTVTFPKPGTYKVWVRTRNWVAPWTTKHAPGKFQLLVDGKALPVTFGTESNPWFWQSGGSVTIAPGKTTVKLALHDLTGFAGRADAVCFSSDANFTPPNEKEALLAFRRKELGLPKTPPNANDAPFDLVVVGGGIAGTCAAVSAASYGIKVALIQNRPVLGGNGSSEVRVHLNGKINLPPYPNLGNLTYLMGPHGGGNARNDGEHYADAQKEKLAESEKTLSLFLSTHVYGVEKKGDKIVAVLGRNIRTGKETRFPAALFADCTGDGTVGYLAGADWRMGRESKAETGEALAPEKADKMTMGASIQWNTANTDKVTKFPELPWAIQFSKSTIKPAIKGDWDWETGMNYDQIWDIERIRDHGFRAAYGHWAWMKNNAEGKWADSVAKRKIAWMAFIAGKRESRRLLGDVILKQQDITPEKKWEDACATTTWTIDLHYPDAKNAKDFPGEEFRSVAKHVRIKPYAIPYRCLYSRNVSNLFMAGRDISVTHVALGTVRVMRTGGLMGEVVGMAASICKKFDCEPRGVYKDHLPELKKLMTEGVGTGPKGTSNKQDRGYRWLNDADPITPPSWLKEVGKNVARNAKVQISSQHSNPYPAKHINDGWKNITSNQGRWVSNKSDASPSVTLTWDKPVTVTAMQVLTGQSSGGLPKTPIASCALQMRQGEKWVDVPGATIKGNKSGQIALKFKPVTSEAFRLQVQDTPEGLARIWELELFEMKK